MKKDYAKREWLLDEHDAHWHVEEVRMLSGKIALACLLTMFLIALFAIYVPAEASTVWQEVSDQSLVDQWGEE